jgi:hypothetical protein
VCQCRIAASSWIRIALLISCCWRPAAREQAERRTTSKCTLIQTVTFLHHRGTLCCVVLFIWFGRKTPGAAYLIGWADGNKCHETLVVLVHHFSPCFVWLISHHQTAVLFSQNKSATSNQYFSLRTHQHQPSATMQTNSLSVLTAESDGGACFHKSSALTDASVVLRSEREKGRVSFQTKWVCLSSFIDLLVRGIRCATSTTQVCSTNSTCC